MAVAIQMPKQGNTVEECLLVEWRVKEGDAVAVGDIVCAIETDKASFEVEATAAGTVLRLLAKEGDLVPVLADILLVGEAGEAPAAPPAAQPAGERPEEAAAAPVERAVPAGGAAGTPPPAAGEDDFRPVSPRARNLALTLGVDPAAIQGSGPGGRVVSTDIRRAVEDGSAIRATPLAREVMAATGDRPVAATGLGGRARARDLGKPVAPAVPAAPAAGAAPVSVAAEPVRVVPYKGIRKLIGDRMHQSLRDGAQLTLNASANAAGLMELRRIFKENAEAAGLPSLTINDLVCWVVAQTLPAFPEINALFDKEKAIIAQHQSVNLAFAVDTPRGLMVPVVADAERLSPAELASAMAALAEDCRRGSVNPDFLAGGTFTISNLGGLGVESFTPVLNPPQVGILGVCAIRQVPVPAPDGGVAFQPRIGLSLTFDHHAVDGAPAARFLQAVAKGIESVQASFALKAAR